MEEVDSRGEMDSVKIDNSILNNGLIFSQVCKNHSTLGVETIAAKDNVLDVLSTSTEGVQICTTILLL